MVQKKSLQAEPRKRGRPAKSRSDASVDIRRAALKAFARGGFNGASIVEIAQMAGVAKPLVHYHFASKEVLWEAAIGAAISDLHTEVLAFQQAFSPGMSVNDSMRQLARQLVVFASRHPELVRIVVDETGKGGSRAEWLRANLLVPGYSTAKLVLEDIARSAGPEMAMPSVEHVVPVMLGVMNFPFMDAEVIRETTGVDVYSSAYVERHGELLSKILSVLMFGA